MRRLIAAVQHSIARHPLDSGEGFFISVVQSLVAKNGIFLLYSGSLHLERMRLSDPSLSEIAFASD